MPPGGLQFRVLRHPIHTNRKHHRFPRVAPRHVGRVERAVALGVGGQHIHPGRHAGGQGFRVKDLPLQGVGVGSQHVQPGPLPRMGDVRLDRADEVGVLGSQLVRPLGAVATALQRDLREPRPLHQQGKVGVQAMDRPGQCGDQLHPAPGGPCRQPRRAAHGAGYAGALRFGLGLHAKEIPPSAGGNHYASGIPLGRLEIWQPHRQVLPSPVRVKSPTPRDQLIQSQSPGVLARTGVAAATVPSCDDGRQTHHGDVARPAPGAEFIQPGQGQPWLIVGQEFETVHGQPELARVLPGIQPHSVEN